MKHYKFSINRVEQYSRILEILIHFDMYFNPSIQEKVVEISTYAHKLYTKAVVYEMNNENEIMGFIAFYMNEYEGYISLIGVKPRYQGRNLGIELLSVVEKECLKNNIKNLRLEVDNKNVIGKKFYIKNGFILDKCRTQTSMFMIKKLKRE